MACIYEHQPSYFGPESLNSGVSSDELKIQKDFIKKGYQRMHKKIKELRQNFQNILAGRSGKAKICDRYYEDLLRIWGGSPCVEALLFGASTVINVSIQTDTSSSTSSDNNTTGGSSCSEDNSSIFNTSSVGLP